MNDTMPMVGAALASRHLEDHADWLISGQRDLEIKDFSSSRVLDDHCNDTVHHINTVMDGHTGRVGIHGPLWNFRQTAFDPKIREITVLRFRQALDAAAAIGATHMVVHSPFEFLGSPARLDRPTMGPYDMLDMIHEALAETVEHAESIGCVLVIENVYDRLPLMLTGLVESFESDYVRQSVDSGHAYINHMQGAPPPDFWARTAGNMLAHVHLQDTDGYADRHWCPGDGDINWRTLFRAIRKTETNPRLLLELKTHTDIPRAMAYLQENGLAC
ncbi:MAG: TIM barrel protein [Chloroflexota bacterium]